jgi:hypothetical protein
MVLQKTLPHFARNDKTGTFDFLISIAAFNDRIKFSSRRRHGCGSINQIAPTACSHAVPEQERHAAPGQFIVPDCQNRSRFFSFRPFWIWGRVVSTRKRPFRPIGVSQARLPAALLSRRGKVVWQKPQKEQVLSREPKCGKEITVGSMPTKMLTYRMYAPLFRLHRALPSNEIARFRMDTRNACQPVEKRAGTAFSTDCSGKMTIEQKNTVSAPSAQTTPPREAMTAWQNHTRQSLSAPDFPA